MIDSNIYCVGQFLMDRALYADFSLTKQAVANAFDLNRPSVWRYDKVTFYLIKEYREDYPELPNDIDLIRKKGCRYDRSVPLTPYQVWVLSLIRACFLYFGKKTRVKEFVETNGYLFSKAKYAEQMQKLAIAVKQSA
jgi:hypothetical protein